MLLRRALGKTTIVHRANVIDGILQIFSNAKKHGVEVHGYTEETWNEEVEKNKDNFRKLIKTK